MVIVAIALLAAVAVGVFLGVWALGGATMNQGLVGAIVGAAVSFVGVLIGQYLTGRTQRELEAQRAYEDALRKYLELLGKLLVEHELNTPGAAPKLGIVARAHTLVALEGLDPRRKRILLQFLHEAELIIGGDRQIVSLAGAPLREANLNGADLSGADLHRADLSKADFSGADLSRAGLEAVRGSTKEKLEQQVKSLTNATMPDGSKHA